MIINTLADIGYPHAGVALIAVGREPKATDVVTAAAARAIQRLGWEDPNVDPLLDVWILLGVPEKIIPTCGPREDLWVLQAPGVSHNHCLLS